MQGIFIKDMSLPEYCSKCPFAVLDNFGDRHCYITDYDVTNYDGWCYNDRHEDCPMSERDLED